MDQPPRESARRRASDAQFAFAHRLTADSAYAALLGQNRRALHSTAADVLAARIIRGSGSEPAMQREVIHHLREAGRYREAHERVAHLASTFANSGGAERELAGLFVLAGELWAQARAQDADLPEHSAHLLLAEGILRRQQARQTEAAAALSECAQLAEVAADPALGCGAQNALGNLHWQRNDLEAARDAYTESMRLAQVAGDDWLELPPRFNLARLSHVMGDITSAVRQGEEAIELAQRCGHQRAMPFVLNLLAVSYGTLGERERMRELYAASLELSEVVGERLNAAIVKGNLGNEALQEGRPEEAQPWLEQALADVRELKVPEKLVYVLALLGETERQLGNLQRALGLLDEGLEIAQRTGVGRHVQLLYISQCKLALDHGDRHGAEGWLAIIDAYCAEHAGWDEGAVGEAARLRNRLEPQADATGQKSGGR